MPSVPGYFKAMKAVCDKYGALLIFDEVMCGMGRSGTLHAWQQEGVVPDIQTIGKALGGGYQPIAGLLANHKVIDGIAKGSSYVVMADCSSNLLTVSLVYSFTVTPTKAIPLAVRLPSKSSASSKKKASWQMSLTWAACYLKG